jgi:predicted transposase/invertase (TIGR01784 family)
MFREYNDEYVKREAFQEGEKLGVDKGKQERNLEIASTLLAEGMVPALVAKVTGLTEVEIAQLQES